MSIHGIAQNMVYCFEEDGQVLLEYQSASFSTHASEEKIDNEQQHHSAKHQISQDIPSHADIAITSLCKKAQGVSSYTQVKLLNLFESISKANFSSLPISRLFQFTSFISPPIEDLSISSLQTVVLIN